MIKRINKTIAMARVVAYSCCMNIIITNRVALAMSNAVFTSISTTMATTLAMDTNTIIMNRFLALAMAFAVHTV